MALLGQHPGHGQTEVGAEHVINVGTTDVSDLSTSGEDDFVVEGVEGELQEGHHHQLEGLDLANQGAEGDEDGGYTEQGVHHGINIEFHVVPLANRVGHDHLVEKALGENVPLNGDRGDQHRKANSTQSVAFHKGH
jgi:hypothetical protein